MNSKFVPVCSQKNMHAHTQIHIHRGRKGSHLIRLGRVIMIKQRWTLGTVRMVLGEIIKEAHLSSQRFVLAGHTLPVHPRHCSPWATNRLIDLPIHSITNPTTQPTSHPTTHTHSITHSLIHSLTHSLIHSLTQ